MEGRPDPAGGQSPIRKNDDGLAAPFAPPIAGNMVVSGHAVHPFRGRLLHIDKGFGSHRPTQTDTPRRVRL